MTAPGKSETASKLVEKKSKEIDIKSLPSAKKKRLTSLVAGHIARGEGQSEHLVN